jgi:hypothetical protein
MNESTTPKVEGKTPQRIFPTPAFQALTIGLPFCIFKLLFGLMSLRVGAGQNAPLTQLGWLVVLWSSLDLLMNLARAAYDLAGRASPVEFCTLAQAGRIFQRPGFFLALDTFLAFSIICIALLSGWIKLLNPWEAYLWYAATTLNLISLSLVNLWLEYQRKG